MTSTLLFDELLDRLRREGFSVGTDQYLRMHALFERHAANSPDELKTLLCPLFAMSAVEQERFHQAYAEFFATPSAMAVPRHSVSRRLTLLAEKIPESVLPTPAVRWKVMLAITMSIVAVLVAVLLFTARSEMDTIVADDPAVNEAVPTVTIPSRTFRIVPRGPWFLCAATFALILFGAEVSRTLLRWMRQREHRAKGRPFDWPVRDPHPTAPRLFANGTFYAAARLMKGREIGEVRRLDVPRSILSTIRALDDPVFEYKLDRRVTEYLFLVERRSERDHLAAYVHAMIDALARDGVLVEVLEHDGDPRICWKAGTSARIATTDLQSRFPQHRLVIIGNATALTNPVSGEALDSIPRLFPWNCRAILTPDDESRALRRFGAYFDVYSLANNGLARLAERWQQIDAPPQRRRSHEQRRASADLPSSPDELARDLDPLIFRWLLRCAVHPTLHWDLTRALAPPLPPAEHEMALLDLARLEWFRTGRIPEPERMALVSRLADDPPEENAARTSALRVLAAAPPPPAGSMAARVFEIQQLAHRIWSAREQLSELRPLMRKLRHFPPSQIARDGALMMLLEQEAPGTLVMHTLPQSMRQFLFRQGIPAFGMKNFVALAAIVPVILLAGNAVWPAAAMKQPQVDSSITNPITPDPEPAVVVAAAAPPPAVTTVAEISEPTMAVGTVDLVAAAIVPPPRKQPKVETQVAAAKPPPTAPSTSIPPPVATATVEFPEAGEVPGTPAIIHTYRTIETTLPVSCKTPTAGQRDVDLKLSSRETFESAEIVVLNKDKFEVAEVTPLDGASYTYRFIAAEPCSHKLAAVVRVRATLQLRIAPAGN